MCSRFPLKFLSYKKCHGSSIMTGVMANKTEFIDIQTLLGTKDPCDMLSIICGGEKLQDQILKAMASARTDHINVSSVDVLAPIPFPRRNLFCVGKNYSDHIKEVAGARGETSNEAYEKPKYPQFFTKVPECVIGPNASVPSYANLTKWLDYEIELAVVIGTQGKDISRHQAMDHVFGYTIANDVTARDMQRHYTQFFKGKALDRTCPMGPVIVSKRDFDASNASLKLWINGHLRQDGNTKDMIFDIPEIISHLSRGMTLYPGDIILTGTPAGVGYAMKPPATLMHGDKMVLTIDGIGELANTVMDEK